jgi:hypothetical protein
MTYTTYPCPSDQEIARTLTRGEWQKRLVDGLEAWDGSTIEDVPFIKAAIVAGKSVSRFDCAIEWHVQNRRDWTEHLVDRLKKAGLSVILDGPNARIVATNSAPDTPMVDEIAEQHGLTRIPVIFHSISIQDRVGEVPIFRCIVSGKYNWQHMVRVDRFVVGRPDVSVSGIGPLDHVVETLKKARIRAKKVESRREAWDIRIAQLRHEEATRKEADEALRAESNIGEEDLFAIESAFGG